MNARLLTPATLCLAVLALVGWHAAFGPITFERGGRITIEGTSNVHGWTCEVSQFTGSGDGNVTSSALGGLTALTVTVPVSAIECNNGTMNGKVRETLKAQANPQVRYTLTNARVGALNGNRFTVDATGQLAIAGSTRPVQMTVQGQALGGGRYRFTGSVPVTMTQFGMRPPTAMMGTMRVGDRVNVRFDVTVGG